MKMFLAAMAVVFSAYVGFSLVAPAPVKASGPEDDPAMCYSAPSCQGSIVGDRVPAGLCVSLGAKSVYSLVRHTCEDL